MSVHQIHWHFAFCCCQKLKKPAGQRWDCEYLNVTWRNGDLLGKWRGAISGSSSTQILLGPICYDLFSMQWPSSLPKEEREKHKEENPSNSTPWPISSVRCTQRFTYIRSYTALCSKYLFKDSCLSIHSFVGHFVLFVRGSLSLQLNLEEFSLMALSRVSRKGSKDAWKHSTECT